MPQQGLVTSSSPSATSPVVQTGRMYAERPMISRTTNEEMDRQQQAEATARFEANQNKSMVSNLAGHIRASFSSAYQAKATITERMLKCLRQREGIYEADIAALISESNGTNIYMMITDVKCRALESWLKDIMLPSGERPFKIEETDIPDIPPQIIEKAQMAFVQDYVGRIQAQTGTFDPNMVDQDDFREAAEKFKGEMMKMIRKQAKEDAEFIEDYVDDELTEGHWYDALSDVIEDFATYPTCFLEGPIYRRRQVLQWKPVKGTLMSSVEVVEKVVKEWDRTDPFDVFPAAGAKTIQDGDLCLRKRFTRRDLDALRGTDGFDTDAINQVLEQYANGYREYLSYDTEIANLHDRPNEFQDPEGHIDGIKFFGSIQGFELREWGMPIEQVPDPFREYPIVAYMIGSYVIGARLNPHPLGRRNIYSASFRKKNGSIWGKAPPELMVDIQNICNSSARSICNNAAMASGPQIWQYVDLIPPESERTDVYPWKLWPFDSEKMVGKGRDPMGFFQPDFIAADLMKIYEYFFQQGSEVTGIPAYVYGNANVGGAGKTSSGLAMLMNAAAKGLRNAASNIDHGIITPSVEEDWLTIMMQKPELARGDCKIVARASDYLVQQEQLQLRRNEFLQTTANQFDMGIIGIDGRSELLRASARSLKMDADKIVPKREDMIDTRVQEQVQQILMKLSEALNIAPQVLLKVIQAPAPGEGSPGGAPQPKQPAEADAAGNPMAGDGQRLFNQ
ncbi:MAG: hypothetical protein ABIJ57_03135 [Pseudomonadota bacterium]